ncbi:MAG: histidine--tRNA ligase [Bacteroidetes bacterium]|nr:MAG: histidine--tRNA ligase [Bacteroidota bacterium]RLD72880.1 MAG: histidine--tRNA ligase [Bacteroidota bacterium]
MAQKYTIPKGTRDFSPEEMARRNYIFQTIQSIFKKYGYLPIETPAMENLSTLMGKYGEEGDRLLFKILNSGDFLKNLDTEDIENKNLGKVTTAIAEKGLRYDLTVPFARYVVQHLNEITFPFKRYQIQPVWRADRPQKGRYREFYQCDVDVIGSHSLLNEVELIRIIDSIFRELNINVVIKLNNRKILTGIVETINAPERLTDITTAMDKIDKIGVEKVYEELRGKGLDEDTINMLEPVMNLSGDNTSRLNCLKELIGATDTGSQGLEEMQTILGLTKQLDLKAEIKLDQVLARGLNYYTGTIIEVIAKDVSIGSICGGGRYDNLTGVFGLPDVSGVGISFGADRIYDVMNELTVFPEEALNSTDVMLVNFGDKEAAYSLGILEQIQQTGIKAELYPDAAKMKKQMKYADQKKVGYVLLIGEEEMNTGIYTLKNMKTGEQTKGNLEEILTILKS